MRRDRVFGMSTKVCLPHPLVGQHLVEMAARGFRAVELYAHRSHFDYHSDAAAADLQAWLAETGLTLDSVHAPVAEPLGGGRPDAPLSLAAPDHAERERAVEEALHALHLARRMPVRVLIVHLGAPTRTAPASRDGARRSLEALRQEAAPLGVTVAVEVLGNELSQPRSLVHFLERDVGPDHLGVCLDVGHAHLGGDVIDAIETVSEHLTALEVHDNDKRRDAHRLPLEGTIPWAAALTTVQKVGYDGPVTFELGSRGPLADTLARAESARRKLERYLAM